MPGLGTGKAKMDNEMKSNAAAIPLWCGGKRVSALLLLGILTGCSNGCPGSPARYRHELSSPNPEVRAHAAEELGKMGPDESRSIPDLQAALGDQDKTVRVQSAEALLLIEPANADDALELLRREVASVRQAAVSRADARIGGGDLKATEKLVSMLNRADKNNRIGLIKQFATTGIEPKLAIRTLLKMLDDNSQSIRLAAMEALGHWGPLAMPAVPLLRRSMSDSCGTVIETLGLILAYDPHDYPVKGEKEDQELNDEMELLLSREKSTEEVVRCVTLLDNTLGIVASARADLLRFKVQGGCFGFQIDGQPIDALVYKMELDRFFWEFGRQLDHYTQLCEAVAIKRALQALPTYRFIAFNLDRRIGDSFQLVQTFITSAGTFDLRSYLPLKLDLLRTPDEPLRAGDRLFGYFTLDCPECTERKKYWFLIKAEEGGWYREILPIDFHYSLTKVTPERASTLVDDFMKEADIIQIPRSRANQMLGLSGAGHKSR